MGKLTSAKEDRAGKKTVVLVGMAVTSREHAPWNDKECEFWVLNESVAHNYIERVDRIFQMHPKWDYWREGNFNDPLYPEFLRNTPWTDDELKRLENITTYKKMPKGWPKPKSEGLRRPLDVPFILLEPDVDVVGETETYPFAELMKFFGSSHFRYFTNTFGYMVALAIYEGFERIECYGWEMSSQEEYGFQKPNAEFWLGIAIAKGLELYLPPACRLLGETEKLYGYDKIPGLTKMHVEIRKNELARQRGVKQAQLNAVHGQEKSIVQNFNVAKNKKDKAWMEKLQKQLVGIHATKMKALAELNAVHGAFQEAEKTWKDLSYLPTNEDIRPILPDKLEGK